MGSGSEEITEECGVDIASNTHYDVVKEQREGKLVVF